MATHPEPLPLIAKKSKAVARPPWGRTANWIVALTTVVLLGGSVGGYYYDRRQKEVLAAPYLRLVVTGPPALESAAAAQYSIATSTITGEPVPSSIEWSLRSPDGKRLTYGKEMADENGSLRVTIPADMILPSRVELDVTAAHGGQREDAKALLAVESPQYVTQLTLDRSCYRPGATVYYRAGPIAAGPAGRPGPADPLRGPRSGRGRGGRLAAGGPDRPRRRSGGLRHGRAIAGGQIYPGRPQPGRRLCGTETMLLHSPHGGLVRAARRRSLPWPFIPRGARWSAGWKTAFISPPTTRRATRRRSKAWWSTAAAGRSPRWRPRGRAWVGSASSPARGKPIG